MMRFTSLWHWLALIAVLSAPVMVSGNAYAEAASPEQDSDDAVRLRVEDAYLELRTGPGRGYPKFQAAERDETLRVKKRKTDWVKVITESEAIGWVRESTLRDKAVLLVDAPRRSIREKLSAGFLTGEFGGAASLSAYLQYNPAAVLGFRANATQVLGDFSDSRIFTGNVVLSPFPKGRFVPFVGLGGGMITTSPHASLVQTEDRTDEVIHVMAGLKVRLSQRFLAHVEYDNYLVLTSRNENEEVSQWQAGFSVFF